MSDLRDLYQETVFDHYRRPRNYGELADANRKAVGYNPLCGDKVTLYLKVEDGVIRDASFEGAGCAIATAAASLMTESIKGKREDEALQLLKDVRRMVTGGEKVEGKLQVLAGVHEFPERVKCATLPWHTMKAAIENIEQPVSTQ